MDKPSYFFDDVNHLYWEDGVFLPSCTQILKLQGLVDFSMVKPEVLAAKSILGTEVHSLTESFDLHGEIDPSWLNEQNEGYYNAWLKFRGESGFEPIREYVEWQSVGVIHGFRFGVKIDRLGIFNGVKTICELKCSDTIQPSWPFQLAGQEMCLTGRPRCGELKRITCRLRKNGTYRIQEYTDHQWDAQMFTSALINVHGRLRQGQKLWQMLV